MGKNLNDVLQQEAREKQQQKKKAEEYGAYVKSITPTRNLPLQMLKAFLVGGFFCVLGQFILNKLIALGMSKDMAGIWCSVLLILLSGILTGFSLYQKIANFGGAGALVPITGFANSVCATAIEYQAEGQVFGVGVKIFTIAGPVILYGIFSSWILGLIYWGMKVIGWV
jgi:stage V sporulation protein AC